VSTAPAGCNQSSSAKANIEVEYAGLIQQNDARRAQLNGQLGALIAADKAAPKESTQAQMNVLQGQIRMLDAERARIDDDRRNKLANAQIEADRAQAQCEAAKTAH
jgi:ABC-type phosphate transport system auxiliary subunit